MPLRAEQTADHAASSHAPSADGAAVPFATDEALRTALPETLAPEAREAVETLTRRLVQKLLGRPASRVVQGMEKQDPNMPTPEHLKSVFGLEEEVP